MGRIIFDTATTLNGWIADEHHSLDWLFAVEGGDEPAEELTPPEARVLVEGSSTYEWVLKHEDLLTQPEEWRQLFGDKTTFVFTRRQLPVPEGADVRFVSGLVTEILPQIRAAADDGDIWIVGGGELAAQFLDAGALDRIAVSVAPAALPSGAPLFPRRVGPDRLRLVSAEAVGQFARLIYDIIPAGPAQ
ncbi:dihydrofolate reductase [Leucobacter insecticola]|uniref:Dihydrofolate reductase n=1 Tax=Leucobacter insecticola TaxID=2714934 RepID=A0A6G8FJX6_9MICO|nr:dihydrofolate reductase family protein [Leucobacter insecticola]QIM16677.1 dihydrofolate reductase [Leucobacter insecticola]